MMTATIAAIPRIHASMAVPPAGSLPSRVFPLAPRTYLRQALRVDSRRTRQETPVGRAQQESLVQRRTVRADSTAEPQA
jgi:hypothetical protein